MLKKVYQSPPHRNFFTGYYDSNVFNSADKHLIACEVDDCFEYPSGLNKPRLVIIDIENESIRPLFDLNCVNFQQGCRASFLNGKYNNSIIFNHFEDKNYASIIISPTGEKIRENSFPIYSISKDSSVAASIDFRRHDLLKRGYSYGHFTNSEELLDANKDQGLVLFNPSSNSLIDRIHIRDLPTFREGLDNQYIDHPMINNDGSLVAFYHRLKNKDTLISNLYIYNLFTKELSFFSKVCRGTHFNWYDSDTLIIWASLGSSVSRIRSILPLSARKLILFYYKKFIKANSETGNTALTKALTGDQYHLVESKTQRVTKISPYGKILIADGHPNLTHNSPKILITDTYPNQDHIQRLIAINLENPAQYTELNFYHNHAATRTPFRCDLHPKLSHSNKYVAIDTFDTNRACIVYELTQS